MVGQYPTTLLIGLKPIVRLWLVSACAQVPLPDRAGGLPGQQRPPFRPHVRLFRLQWVGWRGGTWGALNEAGLLGRNTVRPAWRCPSGRSAPFDCVTHSVSVLYPRPIYHDRSQQIYGAVRWVLVYPVRPCGLGHWAPIFHRHAWL